MSDTLPAWVMEKARELFIATCRFDLTERGEILIIARALVEARKEGVTEGLRHVAASIEQANQLGRAAALEEAAKWHDARNQQLTAEARTFMASGPEERGDVESEVLYTRMASLHKNSAAAIRALIDKP